MLKISQLTFGYTEEKMIFKDFELAVNQAEFICLQGKNGSGKTTLLNIIAGVTYAPEIKLEFFGREITQKDLKDEVIYLPTRPEFYDELTVDDFIDLVSYLWGQGKDFKEQVYRYISKLDLKYAPKQVVGNFSLGMQYKLYLATFLAIPRKILLLDEPFNALDVISRKVAIALVKRYVAKNQGCCIFSSHVTATIEQLETRVINIEGEADEK
ncbi:MAG TPA: ABC transporter ATP-binding protein [Lactobacillus sp.]|uniref:ATP-binding cassette domain-containing protein n=1 Tax=Ligilactobacillus murinus TaxID=1622 RepID=UPI00096F268F|nr:ATP-binding cassette domain-containing protein [Ligilactobacillus murinus]HAB49476.1 ABC transporter ATP-binding protein [Lactobacillus sp.]HAP23121.1 ABC transporter ATP-binding protein [Lactobacillus sp.]